MAVAILPSTFNVGTEKNYSVFQDPDVAHDTAVAVKTTAGRVLWVSIDHKSATESGFLLFWNAIVANVVEAQNGDPIVPPDFSIAFGTSVGAGAINMHINLIFDVAISISCSLTPDGADDMAADPAVVLLYA